MKGLSKKARIMAIIAVLVMTFTIAAPSPAQAKKKKGKVKSVTVTNLPGKTLTVKKGKSFKLKTKVKVTKKASKALSYKSSKSSVATVSGNGVINAKKKGKAKITITSKENKKKKVVIKLTVGTPVTKVKLNKKKSTIATGDKLSLKAKVKKKNASNKGIVWKSSKPKVASVSSKGVVTGIKGGKAKITAYAADGSGKKAVCKVTVKNIVKLTGITAPNRGTIKANLNMAANLTKDNFVVRTKSTNSNAYNYIVPVLSVTAAKNKKSYTLTLKERLYNRDNVLVTLYAQKRSSSAKMLFRERTYNYTSEEVVFKETGKRVYEVISPDHISEESSYSIKNTPKGFAATTYNGTSVRFYGVHTQTSDVVTTIVFKDGYGNTETKKVTWKFFNSNKLAAGGTNKYYTPSPYFEYPNDKRVFKGYRAYVGSYYDDEDDETSTSLITVRGGSGNYSYKVSVLPSSLNMSESGIFSGWIAGSTTLTITVTDKNNPKLTTSTKIGLNVAPMVAVTGKITDAKGGVMIDKNDNKGNPVSRDARISFNNIDYTSRYNSSGGVYYDYSTGIYSAYIVKGNYDVYAYDDNASSEIRVEKRLYSQKITSNKSNYNFVLPGYKAIIGSKDNRVSLDDISDLEWRDAKGYYYGYGRLIYLPKGTHTLYATGSNFLGNFNATLKVTINSNHVTVYPSFSFSSQVKALVEGENNVTVTDDTVYYSFTPATAGTYYFSVKSANWTYMKIMDASRSFIDSSYFSDNNLPNSCEGNLAAKKTYYIAFNNEDYDGNAPAKIIISRTNPMDLIESLTIDTDKTLSADASSNYKYYKFTAPSDGDYDFTTSNGNGDYSVYMSRYDFDDDYDSLYSDDTSRFYIESDETVYLRFRADSTNASVNLKISKSATQDDDDDYDDYDD